MTINNKVTDRDRDWNAKKFIELSDNLGAGYNPGLSNAKLSKKTDFWTVDKLISMSRHLSSAYGVDV